MEGQTSSRSRRNTVLPGDFWVFWESRLQHSSYHQARRMIIPLAVQYRKATVLSLTTLYATFPVKVQDHRIVLILLCKSSAELNRRSTTAHSKRYIHPSQIAVAMRRSIGSTASLSCRVHCVGSIPSQRLNGRLNSTASICSMPSPSRTPKACDAKAIPRLGPQVEFEGLTCMNTTVILSFRF